MRPRGERRRADGDTRTERRGGGWDDEGADVGHGKARMRGFRDRQRRDEGGSAARAAEVLAQIRRAGADVARAAQVFTGPERDRRIDAVVEALLAASPVVVTTHANADGDAAGSAVAMAAFLREHGADVRIASATPFGENFSFLLPDPEWVLPAKSEAEAAWCRRAGLAVVVDTSDPRRIGRINSMIRGCRRSSSIIIPLIRPLLRRPGACRYESRRAGELVFRTDRARRAARGPRRSCGRCNIAVLTDTGGFRFQNTSPDCLRGPRSLVELGADPEGLYRAAYSGFPASPLRVAPGGAGDADGAPGRARGLDDRAEGSRSSGLAPRWTISMASSTCRATGGVEVAILFRTTRRRAHQGVAARAGPHASTRDREVSRRRRSPEGGGGRGVGQAGRVVEARGGTWSPLEFAGVRGFRREILSFEG